MPLMHNKRVILAKLETTYGTDPTPTGLANSIQVSNLEITPLNATVENRDLVRPFLGSAEQLVTKVNSVITFEVEMAGSGTAGTAPAYGPLLQACAMAETVSAGVSVTYAPVSSSMKSITLYFNVDGVLHKVKGARGTVAMSIDANQIPKFKFTFTGLYTGPTDTAAPTPTYTSWQTPLAANSTNSTTLSLHGYSAILQSLSIDLKNAVAHRSLIGAEDVQVTNRAVDGQAVIEAPTMTLKNYFTPALAATIGALDITHGTAGGNKVQITSSQVVVGAPAYSESDGIVMLTLPLSFVPSTAGNDEVSIVVK